MARAIAVAALRYFMVKFNLNTVIAFDFKEALNFEGDSGPYLQYTMVRLNSILKKAAAADLEAAEPPRRPVRLARRGKGAVLGDGPAPVAAGNPGGIRPAEPRALLAGGIRLRLVPEIQPLLPPVPDAGRKRPGAARPAPGAGAAFQEQGRKTPVFFWGSTYPNACKEAG